MGDQPGAGEKHSYKIRGHSRQRRSAKPYSRPSDRKKGVLESVKNFFSPSWLVDFWKGKITLEEEEVEDDEDVEEPGNPTDMIERGQDSSRVSPVLVNIRPSGETSSNTTTDSIYKMYGNGGLGSVASTQIPNQTSRKSGFSAFLALTSRHQSNKETVVTRTAGINSESWRPADQERLEGAKSTGSSSSDHIDTNNEGESSSQLLPTRTASTTKDPNSTRPSFDVNVIRDPSRGAMPSLFSTSTPVLGASTATPAPASQRITPSTQFRPQSSVVFRDRPEFSVAAFGSPLPPGQSSSGKRFFSPFYSGKTTFGGASTKRMRISSPGSLEHSRPFKKQIKPTPRSGTGTGGVASQTAKRILETLENMSSPLVDAKKIPPSPLFSVSTSPINFEQSVRRKQPRKQQAKFGAPPVASFSIPQRASISRIHHKMPSTRSSTITSQAQVPTSNGKFSRAETSKATFTAVPLPMSLSPMDSSKAGGKMKTAKSNPHYKSQEDQDEVVNPLPQIVSAVPLSIPASATLPSFSFSSSSTSSKASTSTTRNKDSSFVPPKSKQFDITSNNFKFSIPEPKASSLLPSTSSQTSPDKKMYSFSLPVPVNKSDTSTMSDDVKNTTTNLLLNKYTPAEGSWECESCMINNNASATSCIACSTAKPTKKTALPSNNLFKQFAPPMGSWCCKTCSISNKSTDEICVACKTPKPSSEKSSTVSFSRSADLFTRLAPSTNSWECSSCMLNNKAGDHKCVACETLKPNTLQSTVGVVSSKKDILMTKFAPSKDSWECSACMVNNKGINSKCMACLTPKLNSSQMTSLSAIPKSDDLLKKFAPLQDSWECSACMLSNKCSDNECVACQTTKPGGQPTTSATSKLVVGTLSNTFAPASGSWTCDACMVVNKPDTLKCLACESAKPGSMSKSAFGLATGNSGTNSSFTFGRKSTGSTATAGLQFGTTSTPESSTPSAPFKFGHHTVTPTQAVVFGGPSDSNKSESSNGGSFVFGASGSGTSAPSFAFGSKAANATSSTPTIPFGVAADSKKEATTVESGFNSTSVDSRPTIQFGAPIKTDEKKDSPFTFGGSNPAVQFGSGSIAKESNTTNETPPKGKRSTIADAAAAGLLKIPSSATPVPAVDLTEGVSNTVKGSVPPNGNLFQSAAQSSNQMFSTATLATKPETTGSATLPSLPFAFGATTMSKPAEDPPKAVPAYSFMAGASSKVASTAAAPEATASPFKFASSLGSSNQAVSNPTTSALVAPQFGSFGATPSSTVPGFPTVVNATTTTVAPFPFKASTAIDSNGKFGTPSAPGGFAFGTLSSNAASGSGGFPFTATSAAPSAPNPSTAFAFGSQSTSEPKSTFNFAASSQSFAFGGGAAANTPRITPQVSEESMDADGNNNSSQPTAPVFGSQTTPSATPFNFIPAPTNASFNFGIAQSPAAGFKFGAAQLPIIVGSTPGVASVPGFGAPAPALPAASGGFSFGSPAPNNASSAQPGGFMAAGSGGGFSAGTASVQTKRIIKKGVRRMKR